MGKRHNFNQNTKETLAKRVGFRCSNPNCRKLTSGPATENDKSVNIGVAAHIISASKGGPRDNQEIKDDERKNISNGIWLCHTCSVLIDRDEIKFSSKILLTWKESAEKKAEQELDSSITEQYFYKGIFFQSKLHACWAVFFDKIKWHYSYEINELDNLKHNFQIRTNNGDELFAYIMSRANFDLKLRQKLGIKTDYAKNILILFESPFPFDEFGYCKNLIGMSSVENKIQNTKGENDFEFCSAAVSSNLYDIGTNIYNICKLEPMFHQTIRNENAFCLELWKESKLTIGI